MKRTLIPAIALLLLGAIAFGDASVDFGGTFKNTTGVISSDGVAGLQQRNSISAWFWAGGGITDLRVRAGYSFAYDGSASVPITHLPDVELLRLQANIGTDNMGLSRFSLTAGRFTFRDHTTMILDQRLDGLRLEFAYPFMSVSASVATSLLPNKRSAPIFLSKADAADLRNAAVLMASPRMVGLVEAVFPNVLRQRLTLSVGAQEDLRALFSARSAGILEEGDTGFDPGSGGLVDTQYMSIGIRGGVWNIFYNTYFAAGTGRTLSYTGGRYEYASILSFLGGVGASYYAEEALSSVAGLRFVLSTGDPWADRDGFIEGGTASRQMQFVPITGKPLSFVFAPTLGNLMLLEASYALKPLSWLGNALLRELQTGLTYQAFLRLAPGPVSAGLPNSLSEDAYLGSEIDLTVTFRPFSDLGVSIIAGAFLPNYSAPAGTSAGGPFYVDGLETPIIKAQVSASISF